jgi:small-conductance mechanosensitive channel
MLIFNLKKLFIPTLFIFGFFLSLIYFPKFINSLEFLADIDKSSILHFSKHFFEISLWFSVGWFLARSINIWILLLNRYFGINIPKLLKDIITFMIFIATIVGILAIVLDFPVSAILLTSGVSSVLVGLLLKNILVDIFSGVALNIELPYKIGDYIELENSVKGKVIDINWRTTTIQPISTNVYNVIPNKLITNMIIKNFNRPTDHYREYIELYLGFSTKPEEAIRVLNAAAQSIAIGYNGTKSDVIIMAVTEYGIKYRIRYWTPEFLKQHKIRTELIIRTMNYLYKAGITPLYQPSDLFVTQMQQKDIHNDVKNILKRIDIFRVFTDKELDTLSTSSNKILKPKDSIIIRENEEKATLYVIIEGLIKVSIKDENGDEEILKTIDAGEIFGEFALLTGNKHYVTTTALTDVLLYEIKEKDIRPILENRPQLTQSLSNALANRKLNKTCFRKVMGSKGDIPLDENILAKKIFDDMSKIFSSLFDSMIYENKN